MINSYSLPDNLDNEIQQLEELIAKFKNNEISAVELKVYRVPFGVYEQREPNTYMVRIRCAAGIVTPLQLQQVALIASEYGIDSLHITTRQELQIHYIKFDDLVPVIKALKNLGLGTRGGGGNTVRNIVVQEDAGIDPDEIFDVSPYAVALTTRLIAEADSWTLPRKFKIAFSGSAADKGYATLADVGFISRIKEGKRGFRVYVAGGMGVKSQVAKILFDFIEADEVYAVAKALKNMFWKYGNRKNKHAARLRFLWQSMGEKEFKQRFTEEYESIKKEKCAPLAIEEIENKASVSGLIPENLPRTEDFALWQKRFVKPQKQAELFSVLIPIKLGFISCAKANKLADFLKGFGDNVVRMSKGQNLLLRNIQYQYLANVYNFLKGTFEDFNRPAILSNLISCAGASTCQLGICQSRQAARALIDALQKSKLDLDKVAQVKLNISGCPNSCGQHPAADLGFFGKAARRDGRLYPAFNVVTGAIIFDGKTKLAETVGEVAAKDLPAFVIDALSLYAANAGRYDSFADYISKDGKEELQQLFVRYKTIPTFEEDKNYYFDWEAETIFSLAGRRAGECSAGIFDLIEMDRGNIKETQKKLADFKEDIEQKQLLLKDLVFYTSRMLLITRGVEPKEEREIYAAFLKHFVETGLVEQCFEGIISAAQENNYQKLIDNENSVYSLCEAVLSLYEQMDNTFNFKAAALIKPIPDKTSGLRLPILVKDLRGVSCPMNFVKTKMELAKLKPGERLEVWLDDGEPIENVPGSVKAEGHDIIERKKTDNYWSLVIEKRE